MGEIAVSVRGLGKRYQLAQGRERYGRLTESLTNVIRHPLRRGPKPQEFWALQDVTFDIPHGQVVGIIGRNGAGKSTLLKILSRITEPTTGEAILHGRVGSLLEVGTGFHPELTGRENIYLSGSILGMRRAEIQRRFDEIVDFAEVERFLDTPVKRYSSGMQVRLGFAVAAHLEPEILIVDEVLAVGDAAFQKKSIGKMTEIGQQGRTILFVSHNLQAVARLCTWAILLEGGHVVRNSLPAEAVDQYLSTQGSGRTERTWPSGEGPGNNVARLRAVRATSRGPMLDGGFDITKAIDVEIEYESMWPGSLRPTANVHLFNENGDYLFVNSDWNDRAWWLRDRVPGRVLARCVIPANFLAEGRFSVEAVVSTFDPLVVQARERDAIGFLVVDRTSGEGVRGPLATAWPGMVRPMLEWQVEQLEALE